MSSGRCAQCKEVIIKPISRVTSDNKVVCGIKCLRDYQASFGKLVQVSPLEAIRQQEMESSQRMAQASHA